MYTLAKRLTETPSCQTIRLLKPESPTQMSNSEHTPLDGQPLVSVIMPCYNTSRYIGEAIDSVLGQDYPNIELLVIDDGSTDDTPSIVRAYGDQVRFFSQQNSGAGAARNLGLQNARGQYIAFLDSDDLWLPGKVKAQVEHLEENPAVGVVYSRWQPWKPDTSGTFSRRPETPPASLRPEIVPEGSGWLYNGLLFTSMLHTIAVMMRRDTIQQVGLFDTSLKRGQDYDYWLRTSRITQIHQLDAVYALYRLHGEGCITKWPSHNYERIVVEKALERWGPIGPNGETTDLKAIKLRLSKTCFDFGYHHYWIGSPRIATRSFIDSLRLNPMQRAAWPYALLSVFKTLANRRS